jgi:hypothetical protein
LLSTAALPQPTADEAGTDIVESRPTTILGAESRSLRARNIDQTYRIDVVRVISPFNPPPPDSKLPVVFVLDGNAYFPMVASTATLLSIEGQIPSLLLVGIGYELDAALPPPFVMLEVQTRRNRDLTPSVDEAFVKQMTEMYAGFGAPYPAYGEPGGADAFLAFIDEELKPFIAERYPDADPDDATIAGHSFGGLFALHALFTSPGSFDRFIAGSPSLAWDGGILLEEETAASGDISTRLFVSVGSLESQDEMIAPVTRMDARLRERPSLDYSFHLFEGETHASVIPATLSRGLREVFRQDPTASRQE